MDVLWVSAVELKKKKAVSWFWDFSHHLLFSSQRLQSLSVPDSTLGWTRFQERQRTWAASKSWLWLFDLSAFWAILKGNQPGCGIPLLCFKLAGEFVKVARRVLEHPSSVPALPDFIFQCKSVSLSSSTVPHTDRAVTKCLSLQEKIFSFFFLFSWKNLSNKTRISFKITRKNIHKYMFTIYYVHLQKLFKKSFNTRLPFQKCSQRKCRHLLTYCKQETVTVLLLKIKNTRSRSQLAYSQISSQRTLFPRSSADMKAE